MNPKISCCLIVRDEASTLEACLQSIRPHVDELCIVDTGSIDGTPEIARRFADVFEVFLDCNDPTTGLIEDFALARNRSFEIASHDFVCWFDGDDIVEGAEHLRTLAVQAAKFDNAIILCPYDYSFDEHGNCVNRHYRERLMRPRHKMRWITPIHEGCILGEAQEGTMLTTHSDLVRVVHRSHLSNKPREPERNLRILKKYVSKVGEQDVRALYYLGLEYGRHGNLGDAMRVLERYIELSKWDDEKCGALLSMAEHYRTIGHHNKAVEWAFRAMATKGWAMPYWALTKSFYALAVNGVDAEYNFRRAAHFAQLGLSLKQDGGAETVLFNDPRARFDIHAYLNVALSRIGDLDGAIASCEAGLEGLPGHELMTKNLALYQIERSKRTVLRESEALVKAGAINEVTQSVFKEVLVGNCKIEKLPVGAHVGADLSKGTGDGAGVLRGSGSDSGRSGDDDRATGGASLGANDWAETGRALDIVFFLGPALENWSPKTIESTGIGGSETMASELAKRLAKLGHRVRLFGNCLATQQGVYDGVEYLDWNAYRGTVCDVLIASRRPDAVDDECRVKAGCSILWVHDVHCGEALTHVRDMRFDRVFVLSQWHRRFFLNCYPRINPDKVIVTRNGVDISRFEGLEARNPSRAIYSSSPDRGLQTLLECWPRIRKEVPDAELHIFYGWHNWEAVATMNGDENALRIIRHLRHLAQHTEGVTMHGRVNQKQLAREFMRSGVWAYPTWFSETSCISAMEAQAAGCRIVTSPIAALNETVGDRGVMIGKGTEGESRSAEYMSAFVAAVVEAMNKRASVERIENDDYYREILRVHASNHFCLDKLAYEWSEMISLLHAEMKESVVPAFHHTEVA